MIGARSDSESLLCPAVKNVSKLVVSDGAVGETVDIAIPVGGRDEQRGRLGHDVEDVRIVERTIVRSVGRRDELEIELDLESDAALGMFSDGEAEVRFGLVKARSAGCCPVSGCSVHAATWRNHREN